MESKKISNSNPTSTPHTHIYTHGRLDRRQVVRGDLPPLPLGISPKVAFGTNQAPGEATPTWASPPLEECETGTRERENAKNMSYRNVGMRELEGKIHELGPANVKAFRNACPSLHVCDSIICKVTE